MMKNTRAKNTLDSTYQAQAQGRGYNQYEIAEVIRKSLEIGVNRLNDSIKKQYFKDESKKKYTDLLKKRKETRTSRGLKQEPDMIRSKHLKGSNSRKPEYSYGKKSSGNILQSSRVTNESVHISPFLRKGSQAKEDLMMYQHRNSSSNIGQNNRSKPLTSPGYNFYRLS